MALYKRQNPEGVDVVIDLLQLDLFIELIKNFGWKDWDSFDRVYKNRKADNTIPEAFIGNGEYVEVLFNDKQTVRSFFLADEKRTYDEAKFVFIQGVSLIVQVRLDKLYPTEAASRHDEKMINDVVRAISKRGWDTKLADVITGVENVYSGLKLSYEKKYFHDMGSFFIARFNFKMIYANTKCGIQALK